MTLYIAAFFIVAIGLIFLGETRHRKGITYIGVAVLLISVLGFVSVGMLTARM